MLEINPETLCLVIAKAKEFHAKEAVVIPDEPLSPGEDWARHVRADHDDDLTYHEVGAAIDDLEPDQQIALVALMWLGRGDYSKDQWEAACTDARDEIEAVSYSHLRAHET